jgi:hypothetical protein
LLHTPFKRYFLFFCGKAEQFYKKDVLNYTFFENYSKGNFGFTNNYFIKTVLKMQGVHLQIQVRNVRAGVV